MSGVTVTSFLVVADQDRAREFYVRVFGAEVVRDRDPVMWTRARRALHHRADRPRR